MLAVDFSQWGGTLSLNTIECWKSFGVKKAIVQYSSLMPQHLSVLEQAGGLEIEAYVYLYWGLSPWNQTPLQRTQEALRMSAGKISRLWLDAEDSSNPYQESQLKACEQFCNSQNMPTGIYTGRWWWPINTNNSRAFSHLPLWHAGYIVQENQPAQPNAKPDWNTFLPYGGWNKPTIWQYQGTTLLCNHSVDLNDDQTVPSKPPDSPPQLKNGEATSTVIFAPNAKSYLWTGQLTPIDDTIVFYEIINALNVTPIRISKETFEWMVQSHLNSGGQPLT